MRRIGVLLINLGTPDAPTPPAVSRYLEEFLMDPWVIDLPKWMRWILVHCVILRIRPKKSAHNYQTVWTAQGSPLLLHSQALAQNLRTLLQKNAPAGTEFVVFLGMRYGSPSISSAITALLSATIDSLIVLPLYPQYAEATTRSSLEVVQNVLKIKCPTLPVDFIPSYPTHPEFIKTWAGLVKTAIARSHRPPDHFVLSFHGLPLRQLPKADPTGSHCLSSDKCCETPSNAHATCYLAQCKATANAIASELGLRRDQWTLSFQSRVGKAQWITPYTETVLRELPKTGVRSVALLAPAFVVDCLETLEELHIRGKQTFLEAGGEHWISIECPNDSADWAASLVHEFLT